MKDQEMTQEIYADIERFYDLVVDKAKDSDTGDILDALVDKWGLVFVLDELSEVCNRKSQYLEENRQDAESAKSWFHLSDRLYFVAKDAKKEGLDRD